MTGCLPTDTHINISCCSYQLNAPSTPQRMGIYLHKSVHKVITHNRPPLLIGRTLVDNKARRHREQTDAVDTDTCPATPHLLDTRVV